MTNKKKKQRARARAAKLIGGAEEKKCC